MSGLLPFRPPVSREQSGDVDLVGLDEAAADDVFEALGSSTARAILAAVYEEPRNASDLADAADTSVQNATYHLQKLQAADLVEVVDTWYSEHGREMSVYGPCHDSIVVLASDESTTESLREKLSSLLGIVGLLGLASVVLERLLHGPDRQPSGGGTFVEEQRHVVEFGEPIVPPGVLFFAGGLFVLGAVVAWTYWAR